MSVVYSSEMERTKNGTFIAGTGPKHLFTIDPPALMVPVAIECELKITPVAGAEPTVWITYSGGEIPRRGIERASGIYLIAFHAMMPGKVVLCGEKGTFDWEVQLQIRPGAPQVLEVLDHSGLVIKAVV